MKTRQQPIHWAISSALAVGVTWLICSAMVFIMPAAMMSISSDMVHINLSALPWELSMSGVFLGLLGWMSMAALVGGLISVFFQKLSN